MGGNSSASVRGSVLEGDRTFESIGVFHDPVYGDIYIIESKNSQNKMPAESNSAPRMYASFYKNGSGVLEIAKFDSNHMKEWSIHSIPDTHVDGPHIHDWKGGHRVGNARTLNNAEMALLNRLHELTKYFKPNK